VAGIGIESVQQAPRALARKRTWPIPGIAWLLLPAFAVMAAQLGWLSRGWPLVHDAPIMHYVAWRILDGAVPYRDLFDMNFPGVYLLHMALLETFGPGNAAWRAFDLGWLMLTAASIAALAARWGVVASLGGALFFAVYHLAAGPWQAGQRDFLLCPFLLLGALGVVRWSEADPSRRLSLALGGLALGAGLTIKPQSVLLMGALAVLVATIARRARRALCPALGAFLLPAVVMPAAVVGWIAILGGLPAWHAIVMDYLIPLYSHLGRPSSWAFQRWHVWIAIAATVLLALADALVGRHFTWRHGVAVVGIGYGVVHYFGQGKGWEYHLDPVAAFAGVVLFSGLEPLRPRRRFWGLAFAATLGSIVLLLGIKGMESADATWVREKERRVGAIEHALARRLAPGDTVQVLDTTEGGIHALLRLHVREPTRFIYDFHFLHDAAHPTIRALRAELVAALAAHPPRFVVMLARGWPSGGYDRIQGFPELARILSAYTTEVRADDYAILVRTGRAGSDGVPGVVGRPCAEVDGVSRDRCAAQ
jgi:hypothetical protein